MENRKKINLFCKSVQLYVISFSLIKVLRDNDNIKNELLNF